MIFKIPDIELSVFTVAALKDMQAQAATEYNTLLASIKTDATFATDPVVDDLDALKAFNATVQAEIDGRAATGQRMSTHTPIEMPEAVPAEEPEFASRVSDIAPYVPAIEGEIVPEKPVYGRMFAAANVEGFAADSELPDLDALTKAFLAKTRSFGSLAALGTAPSEAAVYQVAYLTRDYPEEFSVFDQPSDDDVLRRVTDEYARFGSGGLIAEVERNRKALAVSDPTRDGLVAAAGWCAPSETLYDTCFQGAIDGLIDVPEVQARRGGIRHNQGIDFNGVFGGGTGFFNLTEAQVIAGTLKTCVEIPCPTFVDDRLGVTGLCITGNILQNRGYPEFVRDWMRAAMVVSAHQINSLQIAEMVTGSTVVTLTGAVPPWNSDLSVVSQVLSAVEMAIMDIKYNLRMMRNSTLEVVLPWWLLAQFRADFARRNGGDYMDNMALTDAQINQWFALRGARAQWVLDWQDAFAPTDVLGAAGNAPGSAVPIVRFPTGVKFLVYPAGTWVRGVSDVITLNAVYDSTKLVTNQLTQLFTETGWKMMKMCPVSRVYSIDICPTGSTGAQRAVACA